MKKYDPLSDLNAVNHALAEELAQPKPNEAVVAACGLFKADAERKAGEYQAFVNMRNGIKDD